MNISPASLYGNHFTPRQINTTSSPSQQAESRSTGSKYDQGTLDYLALLDLIAVLKAQGTPAGDLSANRLQKILNAMCGGL